MSLLYRGGEGGGLDASKLEDKGTTCRPPDQGQGWNDSIIQEMVQQAGRWLQREGEGEVSDKVIIYMFTKK